MAYTEQTSVATVADVIERIVSFAAANGWSLDRNDLAGDQRTATLHKGGTSDYVHIYNTTGSDLLRMRVSVGYAAGLTPAQQPNVSDECVTVLEVGPYPKVFIFGSGDQVWATVAIGRNAEYRSLGFGVLEKVGVYTGGTYVVGTDWGRGSRWSGFGANSGPFFSGDSSPSSGHIRVDVPIDGRENFMFNIQGDANNRARTDVGGGLGGMASVLADRADRNAFSGRSVLHPITVYVGRTGPSVFYSPVGVVQDVRVCSLEKLAPEQEITVGSDIYKVFPVAAKRPFYPEAGNLPAASGNYGYAVRKVP